MIMDNELKQLRHNYQLILDNLADSFNQRDMDSFGFKINEFSVFSSFLVAAAFLGKNNQQKVSPALEEFHKSIIVSIVDRITADSADEPDREQIDKLTTSVQEIMTSRYAEYSGILRAETKRHDALSPFSLLVDSFLSHGLDQPLDTHEDIRLELANSLRAIMGKM